MPVSSIRSSCANTVSKIACARWAAGTKGRVDADPFAARTKWLVRSNEIGRDWQGQTPAFPGAGKAQPARRSTADRILPQRSGGTLPARRLDARPGARRSGRPRAARNLRQPESRRADARMVRAPHFAARSDPARRGAHRRLPAGVAHDRHAQASRRPSNIGRPMAKRRRQGGPSCRRASPAPSISAALSVGSKAAMPAPASRAPRRIRP